MTNRNDAFLFRCLSINKFCLIMSQTRKISVDNIVPSSPCFMVRRPPIDDIDYGALSFDDDTSEDESSRRNSETKIGCVCLGDLKSKASEKKEDIKKSLGLEGSLREGKACLLY